MHSRRCSDCRCRSSDKIRCAPIMSWWERIEEEDSLDPTLEGVKWWEEVEVWSKVYVGRNVDWLEVAASKMDAWLSREIEGKMGSLSWVKEKGKNSFVKFDIPRIKFFDSRFKNLYPFFALG